MTLWAFALTTLAGALALGCGDEETRANLQQVHTDPSSAAADGGTANHDLEGDGATDVAVSPCIACPYSLGSGCKERDLSLHPTYDAVLADWRKKCSADDRMDPFPSVVEARCGDSGLHYLQVNYGLGSERRYFDADGKFVSVLTAGDLIDEVCRGKHDWPVHTTCDAESERKNACSSAATSP